MTDQENQINLTNENCAVVYDCMAAPLSFDFVNFLACAASFVQGFGLSKFHVDVDTTEFRKWGQVETDYTDEYRERKAKNIFIDILKCCPFVSSFRYGRDLRNHRLSRFYFFPYRIKSGDQDVYRVPYTFKELYSFSSKTKDLSYLQNLFRPHDDLISYYKLILKKIGTKPKIIFHLRNSNQNLSRNPPSKIFEEVVASIGEKADCIMVPDVDFLYANPEQMLEGKLGWLANAAFSVEHRLALSLAADLNISWGGGICHPMWFSNSNFLTFGLMDSNCAIVTRQAFEKKGPFIGEQFPWLNAENQIIDWVPGEEVSSSHVQKCIADYINRNLG